MTSSQQFQALLLFTLLGLVLGNVVVFTGNTFQFLQREKQEFMYDVMLSQAIDLHPKRTSILEEPPLIEMLYLDAGTFKLRGYEPGEAQQITISRGFFIGKTEVTQGLWKVIMGNNPSQFRSCGDDCPVESVTWIESIHFLNRLSRHFGYRECYGINADAVYLEDCGGFRLPTAAEWRYAAHTIKTRTSELPTREFEDQCPPRSDSPGPVHCSVAGWGGFRGLDDTVSEWCWDWHRPGYTYTSRIDPKGAPGGIRHVFQGLSWCEFSPLCIQGEDIPDYPHFRSYDIGLRLVKAATSLDFPTKRDDNAGE
ncbi:MAG: hypothetical protein A2284_09865 [Deltaproteobacteria bacterium RIFOXYA12_FULL_61_11]|nr:MAG: hypothetical protein A2284_09865 [Deltaproteobacteria bacterium RIFOXYA12_FULL_61_11]